jgi:hypothetical protein
MVMYIRECILCSIACEPDVPCPRCGARDGVTRRCDDEEYQGFAQELARRVVQDIESRLPQIVGGNMSTRDVVASTVVRHFVSMMMSIEREDKRGSS